MASLRQHRIVPANHVRQKPAEQVQSGISIGMRNRSGSGQRSCEQEGERGWTAVEPREYHNGHVRGRPVLTGVAFPAGYF